jgi:hypothetical protein
MVEKNELTYPRYIAIDGDDVGLQLRDYIISNDIDGAACFSSDVENHFKLIERWLSNCGATIVFRGGDSILAHGVFESPGLFSNDIPQGVCRLSVGFGESAEYAYLALQLAKARGKSRVVVIGQTQVETIQVFR